MRGGRFRIGAAVGPIGKKGGFPVWPYVGSYDFNIVKNEICKGHPTTGNRQIRLNLLQQVGLMERPDPTLFPGMSWSEPDRRASEGLAMLEELFIPGHACAGDGTRAGPREILA